MSESGNPRHSAGDAARTGLSNNFSRRSSRPVIVLVMVVSLLCAAGARYWSDERREIASPRAGAQPAAVSLGSMDSYALGLLLGGLRGPLVMFLWSQSENQKSDKDLENLDTMIEWIRLLQPEFDTVHIFQIWNKAYNISVQYASKANKYDVILGALDYADSVDRAKPDDINIVAAIGQLYFDKLGTSSEKEYYRKRVREETLPRLLAITSVAPGETKPVDVTISAKDILAYEVAITAATGAATPQLTADVKTNNFTNPALSFQISGDRPLVWSDGYGSAKEINSNVTKMFVTNTGHDPIQFEVRGSFSRDQSHDPGWRRMQLDPLLDTSFNVLKVYTNPSPGRRRPSELPPAQEWDDGSALQYLPQYAPYPDGVSTFGIAYNYYKRTEVLQNVEQQRHDQWSDLVIDSRPALSLKNWGEEELEQGHRREVQGFDLVNPDDPDELVHASADVKLNQKQAAPQDVMLAIADFDHARRVLPDCLKEYDRHIQHFPDRALQYQSYMQEVRAEIQLANADYEYLTAMVCPPDERDKHLIAANKAYVECRRQSYINLLRYYIDPRVVVQVLPKGFSNDRTSEHQQIESLSVEQASDAVYKADQILHDPRVRHPVDADRIEFDRYIDRAVIREKNLREITR
jgi:hypothetical protein